MESELKNKLIVITYNALPNEMNRDEGLYHSENETFVIIELKTGKLKYIAKSKIVRIEVVR